MADDITIDNDDKRHWLQVIDHAQAKIDALTAEIKECKEQLSEAEEEYFADLPSNWTHIRVNGVLTHTRVTKLGQRRVDVNELREQYPEIAEELTVQKQVHKIERVK